MDKILSKSKYDLVTKSYIYDCTVVKVVDGDTVQLNVDLGFRVHTMISVRLNGFDAPETRTKDQAEKKRGYDAMLYLYKLLDGKRCIVETEKVDGVNRQRRSFTRYIGDLYFFDDASGQYKSVASEMIKQGHVK